jgi:O-antigen ligase
MTLPQLPVPTLLLVLALLLLPFGRSVEVPMFLFAVFGVLALWRRPEIDDNVSWVYLGLLYTLFVLPMLLALPDAVAADKSLLTTLASIRFVLSCCALLWLLQYAAQPARAQASLLYAIGLCAAVLLWIWCLDGLLQFLTGSNVFGYSALETYMDNGVLREERYINGMFGENDNVKFGITAALLMPIALVHAARRWSPALLGALLLLVLTLILLSGKRGAWITAAVELGVLASYYLARGRLRWRQLLVFAAGAVLALLVALGSSDWVRERSAVLLQVVKQPEYETFNRATGNRLPIWGTAVAMGSANWLNGVGPRGFRYAYPDYARDGDVWSTPAGLAGGSRASHAHQLILELWSETGVIGLGAYLGFLAVLWRSWVRASAAARSRALPFAASLTGMLFPVNTHAAWYSSWSGMMLWLFIGLYLCAIFEPGQGDESA